jgi:hypothetical protein
VSRKEGKRKNRKDVGLRTRMRKRKKIADDRFGLGPAVLIPV